MQLPKVVPAGDEELSGLLKETFGWFWPPYDQHQHPSDSVRISLPIPVISYFRQLSPEVQQQLLRFKEVRQRSDNIEELEEIYRRTWTIRRIFLESINRLYSAFYIENNSPQFWDDDNASELCWLRLITSMNTDENGSPSLGAAGRTSRKKEDYPVFINLIPCHPLEINRPTRPNRHAQVETLRNLNSNENRRRFWTIGFQDTVYNKCKLHDICFKRKNPFPNIAISNHIDRLGLIWVENSEDLRQSKIHPNKKFRILFQKTSPDLDLGLFLWPQFNLKKMKRAIFENTFIPDTPKVPIYQNKIVELCDQDRLILFTTEYRSHRVFIDLQISIEFGWASEFGDGKQVVIQAENVQIANESKGPEEHGEWIDNVLLWPNPCERYSHYVPEPISYPGFCRNNEHEHREREALQELMQNETQEQQLADGQTQDPDMSIEKDRLISSDDCLSGLGEIKINQSPQSHEIDSIFESVKIGPPSHTAHEKPTQDDSALLENPYKDISSQSPLPEKIIAHDAASPSPPDSQIKQSMLDRNPHHLTTSVENTLLQHPKQENPCCQESQREKGERAATTQTSKTTKSTSQPPSSDKAVKRKSPRLIGMSTGIKPKNTKRKKT